ncbi:MAG: hypothetical protein HY012_05155 [Acidobacteria bacterium]|nr:hypothetical protein [Acidobacteriota bacterium]
MTRRLLCAALCAALLLPAGIAAPPAPRPPQAAPPDAAPRAQLSERVVAYRIDARLDAQKKIITATETLTYRNLRISVSSLPERFPAGIHFLPRDPPEWRARPLGRKTSRRHRSEIS